MTREIVLAKGKGVAVVDDEDYERVVAAGPWCLNQMNKQRHDALRYAQARHTGGSVILMHRLIMHAPRGAVTDHINHDGLDNRRANLRLCTHAQNMANARKPAGCSSEYRGVCLSIQHNAWVVNCGRKYVGIFRDEIEAARAYDAVAAEKYGEFANLNFPAERAA